MQLIRALLYAIQHYLYKKRSPNHLYVHGCYIDECKLSLIENIYMDNSLLIEQHKKETTYYSRYSC